MKRFRVASPIVPVLAIVCFFQQGSMAKDHSKWTNAPYRDWYESQLNSEGAWCCDNAEAHAYFGNYTYNTDGSVTLKLRQGDHIIPTDLIVKVPNPTGHAVWWYSEVNGHHKDFCFAPGPLS